MEDMNRHRGGQWPARGLKWAVSCQNQREDTGSNRYMQISASIRCSVVIYDEDDRLRRAAEQRQPGKFDAAIRAKWEKIDSALTVHGSDTLGWGDRGLVSWLWWVVL